MNDDETHAAVVITTAQPTTQTLIDSAVMKWSSVVVKLIVVPVFLWGTYHIWDDLDNHGKSLAGIEVSINDVKNSINDLKSTVNSLAQNQQLDEKNIAGLQQSDIDRQAPIPAPEAPAVIERPHFEHHSSRQKEPPIIAAIQHLFNPPHGIRARSRTATAEVR